jgi:hypothetical protein
MTVDLVVDTGAASSAAPALPEGPPPSRRWLGALAVAVVALVGGLLVWPDGASEPPAAQRQSAATPAAPAVPAPSDPRLLPWPGRGPLAQDEAFVQAAAQAWRSQAAAASSPDAPRDEVHPLWAGLVGTSAVAVLQSVGADGQARVAQVSESRRPGNVQRGPLVVQQVATVDGEPTMLLLGDAGGLALDDVLAEPGLALMQVLPAPDLLPEGVEMQRREGPRFVRLGLQADGLSQPWVHSPTAAPEGDVVASVRVQGLEPGLQTTQVVTPGSLLPAPAPVRLVAPDWGRTRSDLPEDYVDALAALASTGRSAGTAAVLGSTPVQDARVALIELRRSGEPAEVVTVMTRGGVQHMSYPRDPADPDEVAMGAVRLPSGHLVVVAAGPPQTAQIVLGADGDAIEAGPRVTAAVLSPGWDVRQVAGQAYRDDDTWIGRTALDVRDLR